MQTCELTEEMMKSSGWAYQFDLTGLERQQDEQNLQEHIHSICHSAAQELSQHKLRAGPFLIWICLKKLLNVSNRRVDGFALFVSSHDREQTGSDADPIVESMRTHKGYIRLEAAAPLIEGAMPACILRDGQILPIDWDIRLMSRLSIIFEEHQRMLHAVNPGMELRANPYKSL